MPLFPHPSLPLLPSVKSSAPFNPVHLQKQYIKWSVQDIKRQTVEPVAAEKVGRGVLTAPPGGPAIGAALERAARPTSSATQSSAIPLWLRRALVAGSWGPGKRVHPLTRSSVAVLTSRICVRGSAAHRERHLRRESDAKGHRVHSQVQVRIGFAVLGTHKLRCNPQLWLYHRAFVWKYLQIQSELASGGKVASTLSPTILWVYSTLAESGLGVRVPTSVRVVGYAKCTFDLAYPCNLHDFSARRLAPKLSRKAVTNLEPITCRDRDAFGPRLAKRGKRS
jgi:hypothetical protein